MNRSTKFALTAAIATLCVTGTAFAAAAVEETTASNLVAAALDSAGVVDTDPALTGSLTDTVQEAIDTGIVDPAIIDAVDSIPTDAPTPDLTTADPNATEEPSVVDGLIEEHESGEFARWDDLGPQIQQAFDAVRAEFVACRQSGSVSDCAKTLGLQFQVALAEVKIAALQTQIDAAASLPAEQQAELVAKLQEAQAAITAKLAETQSKLVERTGAVDARATAKAEQLVKKYGTNADTAATDSSAGENASNSESSIEIVPSVPSTGAQNSQGAGSANSNSNSKSSNGKSGNAPSKSPGNSGKN